MNSKIVLVLFLFASVSNGFKILMLGPYNGKSHFLYTSTFVKELIHRGHSVTYVTSFSLGNAKLTNYTEVLIDPPHDIASVAKQEDAMENSSGSPFLAVTELFYFSKLYNLHNLQNSKVQQLINSTNLHFYLVILEDFFHDSFFMFAHKFQAPVITLCPFGPTDFHDRQLGLLTPWSFVPHWTTTYSDRMSFTERWFNSIISAYDWFSRKFIYVPREQAYVEQFFGHLGPLPSLEEIRRNISLVLVNMHSSLAPPRPMMPSQINIGGAHIKPVKPLPTDLQKFLDESKHGVIYFSLGSVMRSSKMPKEKIQAFLDAFANLKQRVLWKFEDESLDVPPNVMIRKWMPQNDILAHSNVVLFICHGGLFGTSESLYHGRPMLLIPFFGDQHRNTYRIKDAGYGNYILFKDVTKDTLLKGIEEIISDESYASKAKETSAIFKHNLVHPMDEVMWWIEYVIKFKGAKHLRSNAVNMSWFSYLLLNVLAVNVVGFVAISYIVYKIVKGFTRIKAQNGKNKSD